jgi:tetratricopeptide (TPR) repeat protein
VAGRGLTAALLLLAARPAASAGADVHFELGRVALERKEYEEALRQYDVVLHLKGEDAALRHQRALAYLGMGKLQLARAECGRAVELAPGEGRYRVTLAAIELAAVKPDLDRAEGILTEAVRRLRRARDRPGLARALYQLGVVAHRRGDFPGAARFYRLSLQADPAEADARAALRRLDPAAAR